MFAAGTAVRVRMPNLIPRAGVRRRNFESQVQRAPNRAFAKIPATCCTELLVAGADCVGVQSKTACQVACTG